MPTPVRIPLAWLKSDEAVSFLLGRAPKPKEDVVSYTTAWDEARAALNARPAYTETQFTKPLPPMLKEVAEQFRRRPEAMQTFQGQDWELRMIDLGNLLGSQKQIHTDSIDSRVEAYSENDPAALFSLLLPEEKADDVLVTVDQASKSFTITAMNPNLSVMAMTSAEVPSSQAPGGISKMTKIYGYAVAVKPSYATAVEYRGRMFLRDGYHRCYGLLKKGVRWVPAVVVRAQSYQQLGANTAAFLPEEILFSERPLFLRDYFDDSVTATVWQKTPRKIVRIRAEEYVIPA